MGLLGPADRQVPFGSRCWAPGRHGPGRGHRCISAGCPEPGPGGTHAGSHGKMPGGSRVCPPAPGRSSPAKDEIREEGSSLA